MLPAPESACFLIADISGYTGYLVGVELDHAQDILADLIDTVVRALRPPFRLAKLEGDAAFAYVVTDKVDASLLQDSVEATYFAFRKRLRNIQHASVCTCNACKKMGSLDLKFVVHHGQMIKHTVAGQEELAGRDVILIHRLLKNSVAERLGGRAYALYTDDCIQRMGIDPLEHGLIEHSETIDIIGPVKAWVRDLDGAWQIENVRPHRVVSAEEAVRVFVADIDAGRPEVWEYVTSPEHRPKWQGSTEVIEMSANGRRGIGTQNHCMHGKEARIEEVLDWRPFDLMTVSFQLPYEGAPTLLFSYLFMDRPGRHTRVEFRASTLDPGDRAGFEQMAPVFDPAIEESIIQLKTQLEGQKGSEPVIAEPKLPYSGERFLTQPVRAAAPT